MSTATHATTADELFRMPDDGYRYDLVEGELRKMTPSGSAPGYVVVEVTLGLGEFVNHHDLGRGFGAETGFRIGRDPDTVLAPDVSFIRKERIAITGIPQEFYPEA